MPEPLLSIGMGSLSGARDRVEAFEAVARLAGWAESWGVRMRDEMRKEAPYRDDADGDASGEHLRDSIAYAGAHPSASGVSMAWTSDVPYASFVVDGTEPHEIHAVVAKALHWRGPEGDQFAVSVMHPGTQPNPFPLRAFEHLAPELAESLAALFEKE